MKNYLVSICVPVYGVEKYIERCAVSLFEQTYENIEYIFVNDCTKDNSIKMLHEVIKHYPRRQSNIHIINHEHNRGLAAARNTAVAAAHGLFLMHVDSDDWLEKNAVEKCVALQQENDADIVSFGCWREYRDKTIVQCPPKFYSSKDMCLSLIKKRWGKQIVNVGIWGRLVRRTLYTDNNIEVEEGVNMAEDYQVITKLAYYANNISVLDEPLLHYNLQNSNSYVNSITLESAKQSDRSFQIVYDFFSNIGAEYLEAVNVGLSFHLIRMAIDGMANGFGHHFYCALQHSWRQIPPQIKKQIPFKRRIVLVNYHFALVYIKCVRALFNLRISNHVK